MKLCRKANHKLTKMMKTVQFKLLMLFFLTIFVFCSDGDKNLPVSDFPGQNDKVIYATNKDEIKEGNRSVAIVGATLIDGNGGEPVPNSMVIVNGNVIDFVGTQGQKDIPSGMEVLDAKGMTLLPGLIDAHYHNGYDTIMAVEYLKRGVTSVRDPGAWMDYYDPVRNTKKHIPRLFLTGPHIDTYPPAHPDNSYLIKDAVEGELAVNRFADIGATAVKVYYGLSIGMIKSICDAAHARGIPVTGHLETTNAAEAILAGMDGIEHVTSFGTMLLPARETEKYKQLIESDNAARERGRYEVWNSLNLEKNSKVEPLMQLLVDQKTFLSPTLAVFEKQYGKSDSVEVNGFANMVKFVGMANKKGARIVVGSHTWVPYALDGYAYYREMELLKDAGLSNMEIIVSATMENARFFGIDKRLGSIEKGKLADLILLAENPLEDIKLIASVERVMLNGFFVEG